MKVYCTKTLYNQFHGSFPVSVSDNYRLKFLIPICDRCPEPHVKLPHVAAPVTPSPIEHTSFSPLPPGRPNSYNSALPQTSWAPSVWGKNNVDVAAHSPLS